MINLLEKRHSVRSYSLEPIPEQIINTLRSEITMINSHEAGLNFQLSFNDSKPFQGFRRSYGMFKNVTNYMAAIIDPSYEFAEERAGFFAEKFVLKMVEIGLGTCFVGGTFSREDLDPRVEVYEKVPFVVTFGYSDIKNTPMLGKLTSKIAHRKDRRLESFFKGTELEKQMLEDSGIDMELALKAVKLAPSALNKQPVRLTCFGNADSCRLGAEVEDYSNNAVDLGIAKCNVQNVIEGEWEWGNSKPFVKF